MKSQSSRIVFEFWCYFRLAYDLIISKLQINKIVNSIILIKCLNGFSRKKFSNFEISRMNETAVFKLFQPNTTNELILYLFVYEPDKYGTKTLSEEHKSINVHYEQTVGICC